MTVRKLIGKIHLWLGLASGLVVFLVSISGAIMVFEKEIRWATGTSSYDRTVTVPEQNAPAASPSLIFQKSLEVVPRGGTYQYFFTGEQENNVIINWFYHPGNEVADIPAGYREIHQNPYTRSEEHTSELQSQSTISYAVFCLKKKKQTTKNKKKQRVPIQSHLTVC